MSICLYAVTPDFVAEVEGLDLRLHLSRDDLSAVRDAFARFAVLIFPAQDLTAEQHLAFARNFGRLETSLVVGPGPRRLRPELSDISNLDFEGNIWKPGARDRMFQTNLLWHTDSSYKTPTAYASLLYARSVAPFGGNTEFADMRAALDALPPEKRLGLRRLVAEHSILNSRAKLGMTHFSDAERRAFPSVFRPLVRYIPESGRDALYLASHIGRISGLSEEESAALLEELCAHACQRQFVYTHRWRVGDLVVWDNRCTMHRGRDFDDLKWRRELQRATTSDQMEIRMSADV